MDRRNSAFFLEEKTKTAKKTLLTHLISTNGETPLSIPEEKIHAGVVVISELEIGRIHFFSSVHFIAGQSIVIEFMIPQKFALNAEVLHAYEYNTEGRILSPDKFSYRVVADFTFLKKGERALLREFLQSISSAKYDEKESHAQQDAQVSKGA